MRCLMSFELNLSVYFLKLFITNSLPFFGVALLSLINKFILRLFFIKMILFTYEYAWRFI